VQNPHSAFGPHEQALAETVDLDPVSALFGEAMAICYLFCGER
jgi:hypothetical protein